MSFAILGVIAREDFASLKEVLHYYCSSSGDGGGKKSNSFLFSQRIELCHLHGSWWWFCLNQLTAGWVSQTVSCSERPAEASQEEAGVRGGGRAMLWAQLCWLLLKQCQTLESGDWREENKTKTNKKPLPPKNMNKPKPTNQPKKKNTTPQKKCKTRKTGQNSYFCLIALCSGKKGCLHFLCTGSITPRVNYASESISSFDRTNLQDLKCWLASWTNRKLKITICWFSAPQLYFLVWL